MKQVDKEYRNSKDDAVTDYILSQLQPTMADVEFDMEEHRLAGVTHICSDTDHILLGDDEDGCMSLITARGRIYSSPSETLVLNGKRYEIREVEEAGAEGPRGDQPERYLYTEYDYTRAKPGTVVAADDAFPYVKAEGGHWLKAQSKLSFSNELSGTGRRVLRDGGKS